jgi:hypothetical protein
LSGAGNKCDFRFLYRRAIRKIRQVNEKLARFPGFQRIMFEEVFYTLSELRAGERFLFMLLSSRLCTTARELKQKECQYQEQRSPTTYGSF